MACPFTVEQVLSIYRDHVRNIPSLKDKKKFAQGLLSPKELEAAILDTVFTNYRDHELPANSFAGGRTVKHIDNNLYKIQQHTAGPLQFDYLGTDAAGQHWYGNTQEGLHYIEGGGQDAVIRPMAPPPALTNNNRKDLTLDGVTSALNVTTNQIDFFDSTDPVFVAAGQVSANDAYEIAKEFHSLYIDFARNFKDASKAARKAVRLMERQLRNEYPDRFKQNIVKQLDYAFLFRDTTEFKQRIERIEDSILRRQLDYNWGKIQESVYMSKLLNAKFLVDATWSNTMVAMVRNITYRTQVMNGTEDPGNPITRLFKETADINLLGIAKNMGASIFSGGLPMSNANTEATGAGLFNGEVRFSEFKSSDKGISGLYASMHGFWAKISSRVNNMMDSAGSSMTQEMQYYLVTQHVVAKDARLQNLTNDTGQPALAFIQRDNDDNPYQILLVDDGVVLATIPIPPSTSDSYHKLTFKSGDVVDAGQDLTEFHYTREGLQREVMKQHFTSSYASAVKQAILMYRNAGMITTRSGPNTDYQINMNSAQFRRTVLDMQRGGREIERLNVAHRLAMSDFFKRPVMQPKFGSKKTSELTLAELIEGGIGGGMAFLGTQSQKYTLWTINGVAALISKAFTSDRDRFEGGANTFARIVALEAFGFVRGASNFIESMLEFTPYGLLKGALLSSVDKSQMDFEDQMYYQQRNYDLYARAITGAIITGIFIGVEKALEEMGLCEKVTLTPDDIKSGRGLVICGHKVPTWWTGMARGNVILWNWMLNSYDSDWKEVGAVMAAISGGAIGDRDMGAIVTGLLSPKSERDYEGWLQALRAEIGKSVGDVIGSYVPLPAGLVREVTSWIAPESEVPLTPGGIMQEMKWGLISGLGLREAVMSATEDYPRVDYRGRVMLNSYLKAAATDGIKYDVKDEMLNALKIDGQTLWNGRSRVLFSRTDEFPETTPRFMTDEEYHHSMVATGKIFDAFLNKSYDRLKEMPPEQAKAKIERLLGYLESYSKKAIELHSRDIAPNSNIKLHNSEEDYRKFIMEKLSARCSEDARSKKLPGTFSMSEIGQVK